MQDILVDVLGIEAEAKAVVSEAQVLAAMLTSQAQAEAKERQAQSRLEAEAEARKLRDQAQLEIEQEQASIRAQGAEPPKPASELPGFEEAVAYVVDVIAGRRDGA